jgi:hypothetical protein
MFLHFVFPLRSDAGENICFIACGITH